MKYEKEAGERIGQVWSFSGSHSTVNPESIAATFSANAAAESRVPAKIRKELEVATRYVMP